MKPSFLIAVFSLVSSLSFAGGGEVGTAYSTYVSAINADDASMLGLELSQRLDSIQNGKAVLLEATDFIKDVGCNGKAYSSDELNNIADRVLEVAQRTVSVDQSLIARSLHEQISVMGLKKQECN